MKAVLPAICLLALTGCLGAPRMEYVHPVVIVVDNGDTRTK